MPNHPAHKYFEKTILGRSYSAVHKAIDAPVKFLGKKHRVFFHSPLEAAIISTIICGDARPGLLHVVLDKDCTRDKTFKKIIQILAKRK